MFVPRPHTEALARRAIELLPDAASPSTSHRTSVAVALSAAHPGATVGVRTSTLGRSRARAGTAWRSEGDLDVPSLHAPWASRPSDRRGAVRAHRGASPLPRECRARASPRPDEDRADVRPLCRPGAADSGSVRGDRAPGARGDQAADMTVILTDLGFTDVRVHTDADGQIARSGPTRAATFGEVGRVESPSSTRANRERCRPLEECDDPILRRFVPSHAPPAIPATRSIP